VNPIHHTPIARRHNPHRLGAANRDEVLARNVKTLRQVNEQIGPAARRNELRAREQ
jgi:truncated hemoglobin YjbI